MYSNMNTVSTQHLLIEYFFQTKTSQISEETHAVLIALLSEEL
jgi:hypothetical protein